MTIKTKLDDILNFAEKDKLVDFIKSYAQKDAAFNKALLEKFSPTHQSQNKQEQPRENYVELIQNAFIGHSSRGSGRYDYYDHCDDYGFNAEDVKEDLKILLEKARFYIKYENIEEAIFIAQKMIETIPEEWDSDFDYEGDVQVIYDEAIYMLENLMKEQLLSDDQKESLFEWYEDEIEDGKHEHVGLNTSLDVLEEYFLRGVENGFERTLQIIDRQIETTSGYSQECLVEKKIHILNEFDQLEEADKMITDFLHIPRVRKIKLRQMLEKKEYLLAIDLINDGIEIAANKKNWGTIYSWKEELLLVYQLLGNKEKEMEMTKELFLQGNDRGKYYSLLKKITHTSDWNKMLEWILKSMDSSSYYGINDLKAKIFIEHRMWDRLWDLCKKGKVSDVERYEKHLRPQFDSDIFIFYLEYVKKEAEITHKNAYQNVANALIKMKTYMGGKELVKQLVDEYRSVYKRRSNMMKELNRV